MIKVRVVRGAQATLPIATGLVALSSGLAACAAEPAAEDVASGDSAYAVANPGTGVFELGWAYGTPTGYSFVLTNSSTDEYVRAKEQMTFAIPAHFLWARLHPNDPMPQDLARLKQLSAKVTVVYVRNGAVLAKTTLKTTGWNGAEAWSLSATTKSFTVHRRADGVRFELEVKDAGDPQAEASLGPDQFLEVPVIGGSVPNKTVLFDNDGPTLRHRILEGGQPVRGAELAVGYTDWRAATLVDSSSIDRQIGSQTSFSRFGAIQIPIYGELEYEVSYGVAIDDVWQDEQPLAGNAKSRLLPPSGRVAWEASVAVPRAASKLHFYFHVKAFLKVDYARYSNITWKKYADGERILVREKWDNENGAPGDNWDLETEKR